MASRYGRPAFAQYRQIFGAADRFSREHPKVQLNVLTADSAAARERVHVLAAASSTPLATGRYLTALPRSMLHYGATSLRELAVKFPVPPRPVGIMTLKNRTLSPLAESFIDCARELAKPLAKA